MKITVEALQKALDKFKFTLIDKLYSYGTNCYCPMAVILLSLGKTPTQESAEEYFGKYFSYGFANGFDNKVDYYQRILFVYKSLEEQKSLIEGYENGCFIREHFKDIVKVTKV